MKGGGAVFAASFFLLFGWISSKLSRQKEGLLVIYSTLAWSGIILWLLWGFLLFKDPLHFMHNELSAGRQTQTEFDRTKVTGYHNIPYAVLTNLYAVVHTAGVVLTIIFAISVIAVLFRYRSSLFKGKNVVPFLLFTPFIFDVVTVFLGNVPVEVPELSKIDPPGNYFNIRYSLYSLPAIALFVAMISRRRWVQFVVMFLVVINYIILGSQQLVTLRDVGTEHTDAYSDRLVWFLENYDGGYILASTGGNDGFMHSTGIHQKKFITEGAYRMWDNSMKNPSKYATWVITSSGNKRDLLYKHIDRERLFNDFEVVYRNGKWMILKVKE